MQHRWWLEGGMFKVLGLTGLCISLFIRILKEIIILHDILLQGENFGLEFLKNKQSQETVYFLASVL
jgi:hypothetical protein